MINPIYILTGVVGAASVASIIYTKRTNKKMTALKSYVDGMKKERIDDWFDSASDILTSHQESIENLEDETYGRLKIYKEAIEDIVRLDKALHKDRKRIDDLESVVSEKLGVIFKDKEE